MDHLEGLALLFSEQGAWGDPNERSRTLSTPGACEDAVLGGFFATPSA